MARKKTEASLEADKKNIPPVRSTERWVKKMADNKELKWEDYSYCGEPAGGDWLFFNVFRSYGNVFEKYDFRNDKWVDSEDADKVKFGELFTVGMSDETAKELTTLWHNNFLKKLEKEKGKS